MRIVKPSAEIITPVDTEFVLKHLERCGRLCYKSEGRADGTVEGASKFLKDKIMRGHESIVEHYSVSVLFVCDRGITHEIVRHRMASYSQESTRYCNYSNDRFGNEITAIKPCFWESGTKMELWEGTMNLLEEVYFILLKRGATPQEARSILPNSTKAELIMTANLREWRHFFKLRCSKAAHPQMREVAVPLLRQFTTLLPALFEDIAYD